jgi:hypothetical protein
MNFETLCRNAGIKPQQLSSLTEGQEWIAPSHKGLLHQPIPQGVLEKELSKIKAISAGGGELTPAQRTLEKEILFALNTPTAQGDGDHIAPPSTECLDNEDALFRRNLRAMREGYGGDNPPMSTAPQKRNKLKEVAPPLPKHIINRVEAEYGKDNPKTYQTLWHIYNKSTSNKVAETMDDDGTSQPYKYGDESDPHVQSYKNTYGTHPPANMGIPPAGLSPKAGSWWMNNMWRKPDVDPKKNESLKEGEKHVPIGGFWELDPANVVPQENKPTKKYDINDLDKDEIVAVAPKTHKNDPPVIVPHNRVRMGPNEAERAAQVQPQDSDQLHYADTGIASPNKNSGYGEEETYEEFLQSLKEEGIPVAEETGTSAVAPVSTPFAFSAPGQKKNRGTQQSEREGWSQMTEDIKAAVAECKKRKLKENDAEPEAVQVAVGEPEVSSDEVDVQQMLSQLTPEEQAALVNDVIANLIGNEEISVDESNRGKRYTKHASPPKSSVE